jgi:hypothetical protein
LFVCLFVQQYFASFSQFKCAMVRLLIAHHLSIVADLERSESKRKEAFTTIELAIAVFKKVAHLCKLSKHACPTKICQSTNLTI